MIAIIFLLFWVLILRPQRREQLQREQMLTSLAKGDQIVTSGGIFGTVESVDQEKGTLSLTVAPKVAIRVSRAAVASVIQKKGAREKGAAEDEK